jgi:phage shock protein A
VDLLAAIKEKQKRSAEAYARVVTFSSVAQQAAAAGNEADVTAAVQQKQAAEAEVATLTADIAQEQGVLDQMKANLARVRKEIDDAHVQLTELVARQQGAALQQELSKADLTIGGNTLHDQISTLKTHVEHTEAEAAASAELDGETEASTTKALVDRYGPQHKDVDSEVQALMASAKAG